jgi:predicted nuclease with TOPRIM domain
MNHQIAARLMTLKDQYAKGQARLQQLDCELSNLRETMLRISGAIQVLEELKPLEESIEGKTLESHNSSANGI